MIWFPVLIGLSINVGVFINSSTVVSLLWGRAVFPHRTSVVVFRIRIFWAWLVELQQWGCGCCRHHLLCSHRYLARLSSYVSVIKWLIDFCLCHYGNTRQVCGCLGVPTVPRRWHGRTLGSNTFQQYIFIIVHSATHVFTNGTLVACTVIVDLNIQVTHHNLHPL